MKKILLSCLIAASFSAQAGTLLPPGANDQSPARLAAAPAPQGEFERKAVAFAWALDPMAEVADAAPFLAESREYWLVAEASQLKRGLDLETTAPGAVIRISPATGSLPLALDSVRVSKQGRLIPEPQSFQRKASAAQLQAAGMDVPDGSLVMQLSEVHGQGRFNLQLPKAGGQYLVHVFEPASPYVLKAQATRRSVLAGDTLEVAAVLQRGMTKLGGGTLQGELVSPSGRRYPLAFAGGKARLQVPDEAGTVPGLWEVQLFAGTVAGGQPVQREARTAIEVARPTARLGGGYAFDPSALRFELPVQVAAPGRYELRGTLYATGPDGVGRPVSQAHVADWFEAGPAKLGLAFGAANLPMGYGAPFELRFLELKDQSRMGTLETRGLAAREGATAPRPAPVRERRASR